MTSDVITWSALILAIGSFVALAKFWMDQGVTRAQAHSADKSAHEAHQRIDRLSETTATNDDISAAEKRFTEAVNGLRADFQHMAGRLDNLLAALIKTRE